MKNLSIVVKLALILSVFVLAACGSAKPETPLGTYTPDQNYTVEKANVTFGIHPDVINEVAPPAELATAAYYTGKTFYWAERGTWVDARCGGLILNTDSTATNIVARREYQEGYDIQTNFTWSFADGKVHYTSGGVTRSFEAIAINNVLHYLVIQGHTNGIPDAHTIRWYFTTADFTVEMAKNEAYAYSATTGGVQTFANDFAGKTFSVRNFPTGATLYTITMNANGTCVLAGAINNSGTWKMVDDMPELTLAGDKMQIMVISTSPNYYVNIAHSDYSQQIGFYLVEQ